MNEVDYLERYEQLYPYHFMNEHTQGKDYKSHNRKDYAHRFYED